MQYCFEFGQVVVKEMSFKYFFLFLALVAILFSGTEQLVQFW